jgi:hypothetical protein
MVIVKGLLSPPNKMLPRSGRNTSKFKPVFSKPVMVPSNITTRRILV